MSTDQNIQERAETIYHVPFTPEKIAYIRGRKEERELMSNQWVSEINLLELGIEIVAAMKASLCNWDIEQGRFMALEDTFELTETDLSSTDIAPEHLPFHNEKIVPFERERLHKQALFAAKTVISFLTSPSVIKKG